MIDLYTFPDTEAGRENRKKLAAGLRKSGLTAELTEGNVTTDGLTFHVLMLVKSGKRPTEGVIARDMKARKHAQEN